MIAEKYNIPIYKLMIYNSKGEEVKLESYFKSMNELMLASSKFDISENMEYDSIVKTYLNKKLDLFFGLLDDERISKMVWNIV